MMAQGGGVVVMKDVNDTSLNSQGGGRGLDLLDCVRGINTTRDVALHRGFISLLFPCSLPREKARSPAHMDF